MSGTWKHEQFVVLPLIGIRAIILENMWMYANIRIITISHQRREYFRICTLSGYYMNVPI